MGEAFAGKPVALRLNDQDQTELHFANVHLGYLRFDAEGGRFKPTAYIGRPDPEPTQLTRKNRPKSNAVS